MKMILKKRLHQTLLISLLITVACLVTQKSFAQVKFSAVPSFTELSRDQALQIEFIVEGIDKIDEFIPPSFNGFTVIQGPVYGNYFSINNGDVSRSVTVTYLLMPKKAGILIIDAAQTKVKGKRIKSNTLSINILDRVSGNSSQGNVMPLPSLPGRKGNTNDADIKDYVLKKEEDPIAKIQKNLIVRLEVSKHTCYEGEPIIATYKLYTRLKSVSRVIKRPSFNGFSVVEMTTPESMDFQPDQLDGKQFYSTTLRKIQLFPLQSGELTLEPIEIASQVRFLKAGDKPKKNNGFDDVFNDFFGDEMLNEETEEHNLTQQTKPLTITVKPLPENGKPASFNGAVGKFSIQAALNNQQIAANETGTLKVIVEGKGNLPMINAPVVNWPKEIETFEPTARDDIDNTTAPVSGSKTFEYPFSVNDKGNYIIPSVSLSYFNPETETYETANAPIINFAVNKIAPKQELVIKDYPEEEQENFSERLYRFYEKTLNKEWWWPAMLLVLLLWCSYQWRQKVKISAAKKELRRILEEENKTETAIPLTEGAISTFNNDPLDKARQELKKENPTGFYNELHTGLWTYLQQKYQLGPMDMNKKIIISKLKADLFDENFIASFQQLLDACEIALYSPVHTPAEMYQLLQEAETFIKKVEYKIV
ncbi:MAG: protein BatD [Sphingobacteriales bacterium]|nr:protein BatD [Sphingobacteriales bacterium]